MSGCSGIKFFSSPPFPEHSPLGPTAQPLCDLRHAMPRHGSPSASHPPFPREAEVCPSGAKYPMDGPLPAFLAYLQPVQSIILDWHLNVSNSSFHSSQSVANLSIYQNIFKNCSLKIVPSKHALSKLLPQKHTFLKLLPQKNRFKKIPPSKN